MADGELRGVEQALSARTVEALMRPPVEPGARPAHSPWAHVRALIKALRVAHPVAGFGQVSVSPELTGGGARNLSAVVHAADVLELYGPAEQGLELLKPLGRQVHTEDVARRLAPQVLADRPA